LWLVSVICEVWFALSWLLDQFPKWYPINRETYLDRLALRQVALLDIFLQDIGNASHVIFRYHYVSH
jgi:hypothetical protein